MKHNTLKSSLEFHNISLRLNRVFKIHSRIKPLTERLQSKGGRSSGLIITPRRGDYSRRLYRYTDFRRTILPSKRGIILKILYDPNRTANLCLLCYPIGVFAYILQSAKLEKGDIVTNMTNDPSCYGDSTSLGTFLPGMLIHNLAGKFARSAGCSTIIVRKDHDQALLKLKSGELRFFHTSLIASLGAVGNEDHFLHNYKHAGTMRRLGVRPRTRPSSMNPVDHPLGGRTRGGAQPVNVKGILTTNRRTVFRHHNAILYTKRQLKLMHQ